MRETLMPEVLSLAACLLALLGFAGLALSQDRHFTRVCGSNWPAARIPRAQRAISLIAAGLGLPICIAAHGASFGSLLWALLLPAAAMTIALVLSYCPRWLQPLAGAARIVFNVRPSNEVNHVPDPADRVS